MGKIISLELTETRAMDGIELKYQPEGAENWESIRRTEIKLSTWAYEQIASRGQFGTRYNGSDKIEIHNKNHLDFTSCL